VVDFPIQDGKTAWPKHESGEIVVENVIMRG
jgi:hypothetical protein